MGVKRCSVYAFIQRYRWYYGGCNCCCCVQMFKEPKKSWHNSKNHSKEHFIVFFLCHLLSNHHTQSFNHISTPPLSFNSTEQRIHTHLHRHTVNILLVVCTLITVNLLQTSGTDADAAPMRKNMNNNGFHLPNGCDQLDELNVTHGVGGK